MKAQCPCKTLIVTAVAALSIGTAHVANAQTSQSFPINNNLQYSVWDNANGPSFTQNGYGNYSAWWSNYGGDFTTGTGWVAGNPGNVGYSIRIGYNCGAFSMSGFGMFGIYGWFTSPAGSGQPDTEYYVVEMSAGQGPGGTYYGSYSSDGATYKIYHNYFPNQQGISGAPLEQWISVRQGNASVGTNNVVTMWNHFNAWKNLGWRMGNWSSQELGTEGGFGGSGYVNATVWQN